MVCNLITLHCITLEFKRRELLSIMIFVKQGLRKLLADAIFRRIPRTDASAAATRDPRLRSVSAPAAGVTTASAVTSATVLRRATIRLTQRVSASTTVRGKRATRLQQFTMVSRLNFLKRK